MRAAPVLPKNPGLKILAFVIAVALWILVAGEQEAVQVYSVPLDFALSKDRMLAGETPDNVQVRIRGSEAILRNLPAADLRIPVDLTKIPPGEKILRTLAANSVLGVPSGAAVETVTPDKVTFTVERRISKVVRVSPRLEGSPAPGYRMLEFETDPDRITIAGPQSEISRLSLVSTEPVLLHGKDAGFTTSVGTSIDSPRVRVLDVRPIVVTVRIVKDETKR